MKFMSTTDRQRRVSLKFCLFSLLSALAFFSFAQHLNAQDVDASKPGYAIVATPSVLDDADWSKVVDALKAKRADEFNVVVIRWEDDAFDKLRDAAPLYACFVSKPEEASSEQLAEIYAKTRKLDDDPYGDVVWGIITGYDANDALRLTQTNDMQVERVCGGTPVDMTYFKSGVTFDEGSKNRWRVKEEGKAIKERNDAPDDTTRAIAEALNGAQLFVTSGHATERNWSIGFSYKNGFFVAQQGRLIGVPSNDKPFLIKAEGSKIYLASGNCLMGNIDKPDCMALAMIRNANVDMLVGYVVPTWFGFMGWGVQDYYIKQPGRYTVAEAFFANNQALLHLLEKNKAIQEANAPEDQQFSLRFVEGLKYDRDVLVLYGDPAWRNALAVQDSGWKQEFAQEQSSDGQTIWTLTITPLRGENSYRLVDPKDAEHSERPFFQFLPRRIADVKILEGGEFNPIITENFVMIPKFNPIPKDKPFVVKFSSK